ncbi:hypothetical protein B6D48_23950, partial [Salmonella enterica subsp. enterica serovar Paratyphi B]
VVVGHVGGVHRVAVAAGAGVDADGLPLLGAEPRHHAVVQLDEVGEQPGPGPWIARVLAGGEPALGEVDGD